MRTPYSWRCRTRLPPGSAAGGATLNALIAVAEHLSAQAGYSVIDAETIRSSKILILHSGGDSRRIPMYSVSGKAFSSLPILDSEGELLAPIDLLLHTLTETAVHAPAGLFVASSDVLLDLPQTQSDWSHPGVTGLAIAADISFGAKHGVYKCTGPEALVETFIQKGSPEQLRQHGAVQNNETVLIDSGVVFFDADSTETLLNFHVTPPLDACTYLGVDNGAVPLRMELYSDILICMAQSTHRTEYMKMSTSDSHPERIQRARELLWSSLRRIPFRANIAEKARFIHLGTIKEYVSFLWSNAKFHNSLKLQTKAKDFIEQPSAVQKAIVINSLVTGSGKAEEKAVIEHSELRGNWLIKKGAFCSGLRSGSGIHIEKDTVVQEIQLEKSPAGRQRRVITVYGVNDRINDFSELETSTFVNRPWAEFLQHTEITPEEIWPHVNARERMLWNARLFPILKEEDYPEVSLWLQSDTKPADTILRRWRNAQRVSIADILQLADPSAELAWRQQISFKVDVLKMESILLERRHECLLPILHRCAREGRSDLLLTLDEIAAQSPLDITARSLACIADMLAALAGSKAGLRSGPTRNPAWQAGFDLLDRGNLSAAVAELAAERQHWMDSPEFLMRAARHYEGAAQVLIRKSVETAEIQTQKCKPAPLDKWVLAETPARVDLAGGWTDTPPITYEHGGIVVNMAITVDGKKPITARCRRIKEPILRITLQGMERELVCRTQADLADYIQPLAPGALVKAALLCMGLVSLNSPLSLEEQLEQLGGGLEIQTQTNLPIGSGLGTSSILAGALIAAVGKAVGIAYDPCSLVHIVLRLEQILTTGGGWQDQVGGLISGIKIASSPAQLPLKVDWEVLALSDQALRNLNRHFVLVYTGRMRLARNLLQDVIRRWFARIPEILRLTQELTDNAQRMKEAILKEDIEGVGRSLSAYWEQKKRMAGGVEPAHVARMIEQLQPYIHGASLTGAGGGGFLVLVTKEPQAEKQIRAVLGEQKENYSCTIHQVGICRQALRVRVEK